jgi:hypothetical protein
MFMLIHGRRVLDNLWRGRIAEGAERQIMKFLVSRSPEMAFSDLPYLFC